MGSRAGSKTPCSWLRRGNRCSQPGSIGMLPNPEANPPWQQEQGFSPCFLAQADPCRCIPVTLSMDLGPAIDKEVRKPDSQMEFGSIKLQCCNPYP